MDSPGLRLYLWRQWCSGRNRFAELRRCGVPKMRAAVAASSPTGMWRMSRHAAVNQALQHRYFDSLGLPRLAGALDTYLGRTAVYVTRMRGGVTGTAREV